MKVEPAEVCQEGILTMMRNKKIPRQSVCRCSPDVLIHNLENNSGRDPSHRFNLFQE